MTAISTLRVAAIALAAAGLAAGAQAAQKTTAKCSVTGPGGNLISMTNATGNVSLNDVALSLNNASGASKKAYVSYAMDAGVDSQAEMRLAFSIDGAPAQYIGPQNIANHTDFYQTRSTLGVITVPAGTHTITPVVWVQGAPTAGGWVDDRCLTITF